MNKKSKILIVGHNGLVSLGLECYFKKIGFRNLILTDLTKIKLTDCKSVYTFFKKEKPEYCFLTSVNEGGIVANTTYPAELIYENLVVQTNVIHNAYKTGVKKLLFFASSCVYPKDSPQPMKEEYLLSGLLETTSESYAIAKLAGIKMCQAYNKQHMTNFVCVIPATIFGPHDNFDLNTSHVITALIRRFHEAKIKKKPNFSIWGSGRARREFIYVDDLADACVFLMQRGYCWDVINVGTGIDISIRYLAKRIKEAIGFNGKITFDTDRPEGVMKKLLDGRKINSLGWKPKVDIATGIKNTYSWYCENLKEAKY